jgi:hypothetical protein
MRFAPSRVVVVTRETLPLPLWEGVGGRGACARGERRLAPLPPTPSYKGRGRVVPVTGHDGAIAGRERVP